MVAPSPRTGSGVPYALAGFALLSAGDGLVKTMAGDWPPVAVAALRFVLGAIGLSALLLCREGLRAFRPERPWLQFARGFCMAAASLCFFSALFVMGLPEATALVFVSPILMALLARPLLGERVSRATWIASALAFVGVLVVLRPNLAAIGAAALLPLGASFFFALMVIANRASAGQGSALSMQALAAGFCAPVLIVAALALAAMGGEGMRIGAPPASVLIKCAIVAVSASTAHWLIYEGTLRSGASTIAPTTYVQLLVAVAIGWLAFGAPPDTATLAGAALIVAAGLYLWRAQTRPTRVAENLSEAR